MCRPMTASCGSSSWHPDDAEYKAGGVGAKWAKLGHHVLLCSVTNGDIGHWQMAGGPLADRRTAEVVACSKKLGTTAKVLDIHDGELEPTLENRKKIIRVIREWKADIVIAHRPPGIITPTIAMSACSCRTPPTWSPCRSSAPIRRSWKRTLSSVFERPLSEAVSVRPISPCRSTTCLNRSSTRFTV
jgi:hypothetical protein